jgi:hypothetical protein
MFICCRNDSSVLNSFYSGQLLLSYVFEMARLERLDKLVSHEHKSFMAFIPVRLRRRGHHPEVGSRESGGKFINLYCCHLRSGEIPSGLGLMLKNIFVRNLLILVIS